MHRIGTWNRRRGLIQVGASLGSLAGAGSLAILCVAAWANVQPGGAGSSIGSTLAGGTLGFHSAILPTEPTSEHWGEIDPSLFKKEVQVLVPHQPGKGLEIETTSGGIDIVQAEPVDGVLPTDVTIKALFLSKAESNLEHAKIIAKRDSDGTLRITDEWPQRKDRATYSNDQCRYIVSIPDVSAVKAVSTNGQITLEGLSGTAELKTSNGQVVVQNFDGAVSARTDNGQVVIDNCRSADLRTQNGQLSLRLGERTTGNVSAATSNGQVEVKVAPAFAGTIDVSTKNGTISNTLGRGTVEKKGKTKRTITLGQGPAVAVTTSNGQVEITGD